MRPWWSKPGKPGLCQTKNLEIMKTQILEQSSNQKIKMEESIAFQRIQMEGYQKLMTKAAYVYPLVEKELLKMGLIISNYTLPRFEIETSMGTSRNYNAEDACLMLSITANPNSEKFKFIEFRGYDSRGAGKNEKTLYNKASKISDKLTNACGCQTGINPYSLEVRKKEGVANRVSISVTIKL